MYSALQRRQYFGNVMTGLIGMIGLISFADCVQAASLIPGDLVVSRVEYLGDPNIFNSPNFSGITGKVSLDEFTNVPSSARVSTLELPNSSTSATGIVSSFSSKSEGALMLSTDERYLTYIGYQAPVGTEGVSNSYTPAAHPASDPGPYYNRAIARIGIDGSIDDSTVLGDAYSGDNPRAAISVDGTQFYTAGNADNDPSSIGTLGARYTTLGSNTSTKLGTANASVPKADNFRAVNIYNGNLYVAKGSGGNGTNGIFQVGSGLPTSGGNTIKELPGFPSGTSTIHPFGFFFANPTTLYVADEGSGDLTSSSYAGLQKWILSSGTWQLAYTLQNGLDLGTLKNVAGYPAQTATTGLRNLTGEVNADGTVTLDAITAQYSSISGGEPDPTSLVSITDSLTATSLPSTEDFVTLQNSGSGEVFRGVALVAEPVPEPSGVGGIIAAALGMCVLLRRRSS